MKYAVIYQSKSGNTRLLAERIYQTIDSKDKVIFDLEQESELPSADVYFIGFGIHNHSCSIELMDLFEKLEGVRYALFITCGYTPTEQYKKTLKKNLAVWLPEDGQLLDMVICQGKVEEEQKKIMYRQMPDVEEKMRQMFQSGETHPDMEDLKSVEDFANNVQSSEEHRIPIW